MNTQKTVPGLLSKVVKFVRNPTKDWAELDELGANHESAYDKQALKAMIERKRQNDFIRQREFDQLRKMRSREAAGARGMARSSAFQSSVNTDPEGRAVTLKKIDEIEAQMSKQWWKGKLDPAHASAAPTVPQSILGLKGSAAEQSTLPALVNSRNLTGGLGFDCSTVKQIDTEIDAGNRRSFGSDANAHGDSDVAFSTSKLFALEGDQMLTDPELEEAAILYANGDDAGAETSLLHALSSTVTLPRVALTWVAALLDLYRTTNQRAKFDQALSEFASRLGNSTPQWSFVPEEPSFAHRLLANQSADTVPWSRDASGCAEPIWVASADLSAVQMQALRKAMASNPTPWYLEWTQLQHISPDAMPLLGSLFSSLCEEPVALRFGGVESLVQSLRKLMPSGDRSVDQAWWQVRLDALRVMQMLDEFELVALDYCVTFEVSPPPWMPAQCKFENASIPALAFVNTSVSAHEMSSAQEATTIMSVDNSNSIELVGEILGDATGLLSEAGVVPGRSDRIIVSCAQLVRVDFSAAGSILNWVASRQAEGCHVQFRDVHRLVAAFFNVIGVNEHASVVPRPI